jgi:hypothetical protein
MKKLITLSILAVLLAAGVTIKAQDKNPEEYLGLPGDNLNLYAVLKVFRESKTLEAFERDINEENNKINNLDLNNDNLTDYLMVFDEVDGDVHNIILRVAISKTENQDVAVITVQRNNKGEVYVQVTGDEALYGKNYIIEPIYDDSGETPNPGYTGENTVVYGRKVTVVKTTPVYVATWPVIHYMYDPGYTVWRSSWYWGYYPGYWRPWRPYYWHYYYGFHYHWYNDYYGHYRRWDTHRYTRWNDHYYVGRRVYSPSVTVNINQGRYRSTYSRPELRAEGEATYYKNQSSQGRRGSGTTVTGTNVNRQGTSTGRSSTEITTGTGRSGRSVSSSSTVGSSRRTESTGSSNQVSGRSVSKTEKSVSTGSSRSSSSRAAVSSSERRSSTGTSRSSGKTSGSSTSSKKTVKSESSGSTRRK